MLLFDLQHYVRCIKPNDRKAAMTFVEGRVNHQVKYLGLLENVKVSCRYCSWRPMSYNASHL